MYVVVMVVNEVVKDNEAAAHRPAEHVPRWIVDGTERNLAKFISSASRHRPAHTVDHDCIRLRLFALQCAFLGRKQPHSLMMDSCDSYVAKAGRCGTKLGKPPPAPTAANTEKHRRAGLLR
jgi:hypothetical protein